MRSESRPIRWSRIFRKILGPIDAIFDQVYSSKWNPLYQSGTLIVGLLLIVIVSGLYLLFFYDTEAPYESLVYIEERLFLGSWLRSVHRYGSDAAIVALGIHILRLFVEGKTWGPRLLAWISGVVLSLFLYFSGVTGFVMMWDQFGKVLAVEGARLGDIFPFFSAPLSMMFDGSREIPSPSFFFMNLFLHIAIPLIMMGGLWIHTIKMARSLWLPARPILVTFGIGLAVLALLWPAPLQKRADLLEIGGLLKVDLFYGFWLWFTQGLDPWIPILFGAIFLFLFLSIPWWWRPKREELQPARNNPETCLSCRQCVVDCPYEAIEMVEFTSKRGESKEVASVISEACVSCGLCSGSCSTYSIGPEGKKGKDQLERARKFLSLLESTYVSILLFCENNGSMKRKLERSKPELDHQGVALFSVPCVGNLHPRIAIQFLERFEKVVVMTCPERNCIHREGPFLLKERLLHRRPPNENSKDDPERLKIWSYSESEFSQLLMQLRELVERGASRSGTSDWKVKIFFFLKQALFSTLVLFALAFLSQVKTEDPVDYAELRLSFRLPGQKREVCRVRSEEELSKIPLHMRRLQQCEVTLLSYQLQVQVDGQLRLTKRVNPPGVRSDRPLIVSESFRLEPGVHKIEVDFTPIDEVSQEEKGGVSPALSLSFKESHTFKVHHVALISYNSSEGRLQLQSPEFSKSHSELYKEASVSN